MKLIVTRPVEDNEALIGKLMSLDHETIALPLIEIVARPAAQISEIAYQAACITSANAIRVIDVSTAIKQLPLYTVGPQSKGEAQRRGFPHVSAHGGDVNGLSHFIKNHLAPEAGPILYLSGAETSGDLEGKLKSYGFSVDRVIAYDARPREVTDLAQLLQNADGVLLYSPRTAQLWAAQLEKHGCLAQAENLIHFCLSVNVANKLPRQLKKKISASPNEGDMLALLDQTDDLA
jgi:uroporphyrinogen-III synthase